MIVYDGPGLDLEQPRNADFEGLAIEGLWDDPAVAATRTLTTTAGSAFVFERDSQTGWCLARWSRDGGATWTNASRQLWWALVYDPRPSDPLRLFTLQPSSESAQTTPGVDTDTRVEYSWVVPLEGSDLVVTLTAHVEDGDWLSMRVQARWASPGAAVYALHAITLGEFRVLPTDQGNDVQAHGAVKGLMVRDPIPRHRFQPADNPFDSLFSGQQQSEYGNPSGKGCAMPVGCVYNETGAQEGWMLWSEGWNDGSLNWRWQSDGDHYYASVEVLQPDMIFSGNNSRTDLGMQSTLCLRPYQGKNGHGWYDAAAQYRERLDTLKPRFRTPTFRFDENQDAILRGPHLWFQQEDRQANQPADELIGILKQVRAELSIGLDVPIIGYVVADITERLFPQAPQTPETFSTADSYFAAFRRARNELGAFLGHIKPSWHSFPGATFHKWRTPGGGLDRNAWFNTGAAMVTRLSRRARIEGESQDRLDEDSTQKYWRSIPATLASITSSVMTVEGTPFPEDNLLTDDYYLGTVVTYELGNGGLGWALIVRNAGLNNLNQRELALPFIDADLHPLPNPAPGTAIRLTRQVAELCHHAIIGNPAWFERLLAAVRLDQRDTLEQALFYHDVYCNRNNRAPVLETFQCAGTHAFEAFPLADPNYVPHPVGGGAWWVDALYEYFETSKRAMESRLNPSLTMLGTEFLDEQYLPHNQFCLHGEAHVGFYRGLNPESTSYGPNDHKMVACPMFAAVHAGRCYGTYHLTGFGNGLLTDFVRNNNVISDGTEFRRALYYAAFGSYLHGMQPLNFFARPANTGSVDDMSFRDHNLWDPNEYTGANAADPDIAQARDLWVRIFKAELGWSLRWLRNGTMLRPLEVLDGTQKRDLYAYGPFGSSPSLLGRAYLPRLQAPAMFDPLNHPSVLHAVWKDPYRGSVCIFLLNWTHEPQRFVGQTLASELGLKGEDGLLYSASEVDDEWTFISRRSPTEAVVIDRTMPAYSFGAMFFVPESALCDASGPWVSIVNTTPPSLPSDMMGGPAQRSSVSGRTIASDVGGGVSIRAILTTERL